VPTLPVLAHAHAPRATVAPRWRALTGGAAGAATHWAGPTNGLGRRARGLVGPLLQPRHAVEQACHHHAHRRRFRWGLPR